MAIRQRSQADRSTDDAAKQAARRQQTSTDAQKQSASGEPEAPIEARFIGERVPYSDRQQRIAEAAYLRAEQRGFAPGLEIQDWLEAEHEIDLLLSARESGRQG